MFFEKYGILKLKFYITAGFNLKIAIVDDDKALFESLNTYLKELLGNSADITGFSSGEEFLDVWRENEYDLIILDIFMGGLTGMDVAKEIRRHDREVKIAFSTTSNEYASESYEVDACYYLHKPFGINRVKAMLDRLDISQIEKMRTVKLPDGGCAVLRDIIYADFSGHKVTLHLKHGNELTVRAPFAETETLLCTYPYFVSPSKGITVNFYEVKGQSDGTFTMSDGSIIPISRRRAKDVFEAYSSFRFEQLRKGGGRVGCILPERKSGTHKRCEHRFICGVLLFCR